MFLPDKHRSPFFCAKQNTQTLGVSLLRRVVSINCLWAKLFLHHTQVTFRMSTGVDQCDFLLLKPLFLCFIFCLFFYNTDGWKSEGISCMDTHSYHTTADKRNAPWSKVWGYILYWYPQLLHNSREKQCRRGLHTRQSLTCPVQRSWQSCPDREKSVCVFTAKWHQGVQHFTPQDVTPEAQTLVYTLGILSVWPLSNSSMSEDTPSRSLSLSLSLLL